MTVTARHQPLDLTPVRAQFTVVIDRMMAPNVTEEFDTLEAAIRSWARHTYNSHNATGGIEVKQWDAEGDVVHDGWILHVREGGVTYLNPNLKLA